MVPSLSSHVGVVPERVKDLTEVLYDLACVTAGDDFGLCRREGGGALDPSFGKNRGATKHDDDTGDITWIAKDEESGVGCIHVADGLQEWVVGGKERIWTGLWAHQRACASG
jgi:hypothetical protein